MAAPREVIDLIERFTRNRDFYRSSEYNEAQVRLEFIDPFFKALGWDMYNHEKSLIQRQIDTTDKQIDQLVYKLYGLTEEETKVIEEATK